MKQLISYSAWGCPTVAGWSMRRNGAGPRTMAVSPAAITRSLPSGNSRVPPPRSTVTMVSGAPSVKRMLHAAWRTAWLTTEPSARMPLSSELNGSISQS